MKHIIKLALVALAAVAASLVYGFTRQVAPWYIALGAAGSLVGTYVGLAFADIPDAQRTRAIYVARGAMVVEALYGFLYVLSVQSPELFAPPLPLPLSVPLALLHGAAFSILAYFVSLFIVHERGGVGASPADDRDRAIVETLSIIAERLTPMASDTEKRPQLTDTAVAFRASLDMQADGADIGIKGMPGDVEDRACPGCGRALDAAHYGAAKRWGYCTNCKG